MTVAEPGSLAPAFGSTAFATLHRGAHDDVAVQPPGPAANVASSAGTATSVAAADAGASAAATRATARASGRRRVDARMERSRVRDRRSHHTRTWDAACPSNGYRR